MRYDLPLGNIHEYAYTAAVAARCATLQGVREPFQAKLYQVNLADVSWAELARHANVPNVAQFTSCLNGKDAARMVDTDVAVAKKLHIEATPVLVIRGDIDPCTRSEADLDKLVTDALGNRR